MVAHTNRNCIGSFWTIDRVDEGKCDCAVYLYDFLTLNGCFFTSCCAFMATVNRSVCCPIEIWKLLLVFPQWSYFLKEHQKSLKKIKKNIPTT